MGVNAASFMHYFVRGVKKEVTHFCAADPGFFVVLGCGGISAGRL